MHTLFIAPISECNDEYVGVCVAPLVDLGPLPRQRGDLLQVPVLEGLQMFGLIRLPAVP